jgi:hypothetical protein
MDRSGQTRDNLCTRTADPSRLHVHRAKAKATVKSGQEGSAPEHHIQESSLTPGTSTTLRVQAASSHEALMQESDWLEPSEQPQQRFSEQGSRMVWVASGRRSSAPWLQRPGKHDTRRGAFSLIADHQPHRRSHAERTAQQPPFRTGFMQTQTCTPSIRHAAMMSPVAQLSEYNRVEEPRAVPFILFISL